MTWTLTLPEAQAAAEGWGANCGPGALAAALGLSLDAVHPHLVGFDQKRYTNPKMMRAALDSLGVQYDWQVSHERGRPSLFPLSGLARVQWAGPWTMAGVPARVAYRHTHWIGSRTTWTGALVREQEIFDINCICVGGWVSRLEWETQVVPWLLKQVEPKATGEWWLTHLVEVKS